MNMIVCGRRSLLVCLVALTLVGQLWIAAPATAATGSAVTDFAALAIRPSDLSEPGFARFTGRGCANAAGCAESLFPNGGPDEAALKSAKVRRGYYAGLSKPEAISAGELADTIETTILEFADTSKAKAGLELLLQPLAAQAEPTASTVAPGAQLIVADLSAVDGGQFTGAAAVRFRSGRLVISVDRRFAGSEIDSASVEALAGIILDRIELGTAQPGLGSLVLHQRNASYEAYDLIDGAIQPTYYGFGSIDQERADAYATASAIDIYISSQDLVQDLMGYTSVGLTITLARFENDGDAAGFSQHWIDRITDAGVTVRKIDGGPTFGDTSIAIVVAFGQTYSVQYIVQVGSVAMVVSWDNYLPSPLSLDDQIVEAQAKFAPLAQFTTQRQTECVSAGACPGRIEIPADLIPQV
jgi:hypothetical protein